MGKCPLNTRFYIDCPNPEKGRCMTGHERLGATKHKMLSSVLKNVWVLNVKKVSSGFFEEAFVENYDGNKYFFSKS